jgi:hypothetical protein
MGKIQWHTDNSDVLFQQCSPCIRTPVLCLDPTPGGGRALYILKSNKRIKQ